MPVHDMSLGCEYERDEDIQICEWNTWCKSRPLRVTRGEELEGLSETIVNDTLGL